MLDPKSHRHCGIDTVEIARVRRLLDDAPRESLERLFSPEELHDAGDGPGRAAALAARFAAKEACLKLFPRETALETIAAGDFSVSRDNYGAPRILCSDAAVVVMGRHRIERIDLSLTHDRNQASAIAQPVPMVTSVPVSGRLIYRLFPYRRRVILENLRRAFGGLVPETEIELLAAAHYGHLWRLVLEFLIYPLIPRSRRPRLGARGERRGLAAPDGPGKGRSHPHRPLR